MGDHIGVVHNISATMNPTLQGGEGGGGGGRVYMQEKEMGESKRGNLEKFAITTEISYARKICLITIPCQSTVLIIIVSSYRYKYQ